MKLYWFAIATCLAATAAPAFGDAATPAPKKKRVPPVFAAIEDKPGLPRVLLIGDSISMGYTLPTRKLLAGVANVHRPPINCGPTTRGLEKIDRWLGDGKWDAIHFNWGLHDLKYMGPQGQNLADPKAPDSQQQVPIEAYEENLRALVARLKETGAKLIWRTTTPVGKTARGRVSGDSVRYNKVAAKIMREHHIAVDDQYAYALPRLAEIQNRDGVHFNRDGSQQLAEQTAAAVRKALETPAAEQPTGGGRPRNRGSQSLR